MEYKVLPFLEVYRALIDLALMANGRSEFFQKFKVEIEELCDWMFSRKMDSSVPEKNF